MFPLSTLFHYPILLLLSDGKVHTLKECRDFEVSQLSISPKQAKEMTPGGKKSKPRNKLNSWTDRAISDLKNALFIKHSGNGYIITKDGLSFFNLHKDGFEAKELKVSDAYRKYKNLTNSGKAKGKGTSKGKKAVIPDVSFIEEEPNAPKKSPIEILEELSTHINETLENTLLEALKKMSPESFEHLIKELLVKMSISNSDKCIELTPYVKDDGVDIYVYDNPLKMNIVCCIQVKRYSDAAVGLNTVKELGGTLLDKNCKSGMVITTSQFTKGATDYNPSGYNIQKIDGIKLTKLLISNGLAIKTKRVEVKTVDIDFLNSL